MELYTVSWSNRACTAATAQTMVQLVTGATRRLQLLEFSLSFDGVTSTAEPVDWFIRTQTTAGTAGAATPRPIDTAGPAAISTAQTGFSGAEPTTGVDMYVDMLHPQGGLYTMSWAPFDPKAPRLAISSKLGLVVTAPAGVNCSGYVTFME